MTTAKEAVRRLIDRLPDDVSYEEIQYRITVREKIEASLAAVEAGLVVPHDEARNRLWGITG